MSDKTKSTQPLKLSPSTQPLKLSPHDPIPSPERHERLENARQTRLDEFGREMVSPLPMEPPLGYVRHKSIAEQIREMVRSEHLRLAAQAAGLETFEEADDFEIGDDFEPDSPYENEFDPSVSELVREGEAEISRRAEQADLPLETPVPPASSTVPT